MEMENRSGSEDSLSWVSTSAVRGSDVGDPEEDPQPKPQPVVEEVREPVGVRGARRGPRHNYDYDLYHSLESHSAVRCSDDKEAQPDSGESQFDSSDETEPDYDASQSNSYDTGSDSDSSEFEGNRNNCDQPKRQPAEEVREPVSVRGARRGPRTNLDPPKPQPAEEVREPVSVRGARRGKRYNYDYDLYHPVESRSAVRCSDDKEAEPDYDESQSIKGDENENIRARWVTHEAYWSTIDRFRSWGSNYAVRNSDCEELESDPEPEEEPKKK